MKSAFLSLCICCLFVVSCQPNTEKNTNIITQTDLHDILFDLHLVDAMLTSNVLSKSEHQINDKNLYFSVFEKHNTSKEKFDSTIYYYVNNDFETLQNIYNDVIEEFNYNLGVIQKD